MYNEKKLPIRGNGLDDLNSILMINLERLSDDTLTKAELKLELKKSVGIARVSREIIEVAKVRMTAAQMYKNGILITNMNSGVQILEKTKQLT